MKYVTKTAAFLMSAAAALSLTACSGDVEGSADNDSSVNVSLNYVSSANISSDNESSANIPANDESSGSVRENDGSPADMPWLTTGWDPEEVTWEEPEIGGSAVLSSASLDGIDASLIAYNITHLPEDETDDEFCEGHLCAERVLLYLKDGKGRRALSTQINSESLRHHTIHGECLFDGCTRIYKVEQDGETYYLLMQYAEYDKDNDALLATFYILDMALYDEKVPKDENGISGGGLWIFAVSGPEDRQMSLWWQCYQASKDFVYKDGTTFADPEYGYEITFDMKKGTANVVYPDNQ